MVGLMVAAVTAAEAYGAFLEGTALVVSVYAIMKGTRRSPGGRRKK